MACGFRLRIYRQSLYSCLERLLHKALDCALQIMIRLHFPTTSKARDNCAEARELSSNGPSRRQQIVIVSAAQGGIESRCEGLGKWVGRIQQEAGYINNNAFTRFGWWSKVASLPEKDDNGKGPECSSPRKSIRMWVRAVTISGWIIGLDRFIGDGGEDCNWMIRNRFAGPWSQLYNDFFVVKWI